jgi:hypothetical protein
VVSIPLHRIASHLISSHRIASHRTIRCLSLPVSVCDNDEYRFSSRRTVVATVRIHDRDIYDVRVHGVLTARRIDTSDVTIIVADDGRQIGAPIINNTSFWRSAISPLSTARSRANGEIAFVELITVSNRSVASVTVRQSRSISRDQSSTATTSCVMPLYSIVAAPTRVRSPSCILLM